MRVHLLMQLLVKVEQTVSENSPFEEQVEWHLLEVVIPYKEAPEVTLSSLSQDH